MKQAGARHYDLANNGELTGIRTEDKQTNKQQVRGRVSRLAADRLTNNTGGVSVGV